MRSTKDYTISVIRMISTGLVVILHIFQQMEKINVHLHYATDWLNLGLVMFFCISGFLYSERTIERFDKWIIYRYKVLIIPSVTAVFLTIIVYWISMGHLPITTVFFSLLSGLGFEAFVPDAWMFVQCWVLTYILFCYALLPLVQNINVKKYSEVQFWGGLVFTSLLLQAVTSGAKILLNLPILSWGILLRFFLPYFVYRRYEDIERKKVFLILTPLAVLSIGVACFVRYHSALAGVMTSVAELIFIYAQTISGVVLFHWLYSFLSKVKLYESVLNISDKYSYYVFLTHCLFIGYNTSVIFKFQSYWVGIAAALLLTGAASVILRMISNCFLGKRSRIKRE